ncbi:MAG: response regulator [bacterium]|nr:response regulator [bacterium]
MKEILVVDDEKDIQDMLSELLKESGFQVSIAGDGQEALEIIRKRKPDLVLLDIFMPPLDGWATLKILKTEDETKSIPVIMLTGMNEAVDRLTSFYLHADGYVSKPFVVTNLLEVINETLSRKKGRGSKKPL